MYSTHNEGKSFVAEKLTVVPLKTKIYDFIIKKCVY